MTAMLLALILHGPVHVTPGPVVCHPVQCTQHRTIRDATTTVVQVRHRPAESRSLAPAPWRHWRLASVSRGAW